MTPFFANYSLIVILIEELIREMNLDIYRVIEFILFHMNTSFCIGWDKMEFWCVFVALLCISPQVNLAI